MDWLQRLFSTEGYTPRRECGGWTADWITLHTASDLLIFLAYVSIPLILLVSVRRRTLDGIRTPVVLFALFILACGTTHLIEALMFDHPAYRLSGVAKAVTAAVSWLTVFMVVPVVPKVLARLGPVADEPAGGGRLAGRPALVYALAVMVGLAVVMLRYSLNGLLADLHPFHVPLMGVVLVAWYGGFRPGMVTLAVVSVLVPYLFLPPQGSWAIERLSDVIGLGLFLFTGLSVCVLGQLQQTGRRRLTAQVTAVSAASAALEQEKRATDRALGQLDALVRNAPYSIAFFDDDLRFLRVNDAFAAAHGLTVEAHFGRRLNDVASDFAADVLAEYRNVLTTGEPMIGRLVPGTERVWEVSAFPVPMDSGRVGLGVIGKDVTERHTAAERVKESEARLSAIANGIPQLAWMARPDGHIFWYNQRWFEYTGTTQQEMEGWGWEKVHDPVELKRMSVTWRAALASGRPWEDTFPLRRHDGQMRWHLSRAVPSKDAEGNVVYWFGTNTDITSQRELEDTLRQNEAYIRGVLDNSPDCIKVLDPAGRLIEFNGPGMTAMGIDDFAPLKGREWADLWPAESQERVRRAIATAAAGTVDRFSGWSPTLKGERKFWDVIVAPIPDASGKTVRLVGVSRDVTDQKRGEEELREAQRFSDGVVNSLPAHLAVIDAGEQIVSVNDAWRQFGETNGVPPGLEWVGSDYFAPGGTGDTGGDGADPIAAGIRGVLRGERDGFDAEYPCHAPDTERYFHLRASRFRGDGPVRVVVTHENITGRVQAERAAREQASQLLQLTEGMPFLMWACRPSGECDYLSRQWIEYTGAGLGEQLGYGWLEAVHPDDRSRTSAAWQGAVGGGTMYDVEFRLRRHDGAYRWFGVRGVPVHDAGGRVVRWYGSCVDVEDRKQQADTLERLVTDRTAALHQSNAELVQQQSFVDAILDNVAEGIVACDSDGRLKLFNAATRAMHALPAESLSSDHWADHYSLFEADGTTPMTTDRVPLVRAWRGEAVKDAEMVIRPAGDADDRFVLCSGQPLRTPAGEVFGAVVSMRDVTDAREHERELVRTSELLAASNDDLEKFAYIASHDLQEPLRKIQAFGDRLVTKCRDALSDQGKDYLDRMMDSAGRMRRLIEDLLAFSRVTSRSKPTEAVDLGEVVRGVLSDLDELVRRTGGRVDVGPLPTVPADAGQTRQLFQNLIGNALKFHRPDAPPVVSVSAEPLADAAGWRITVADNGIGFEPQHADRIFELFQRLHGRTKYEGTGLGLAIVKKIVARHGGSIAARGNPGEGATFTIDWPGTPGDAP